MSHHNGLSDTKPIRVPDETIIYTPPSSVVTPPQSTPSVPTPPPLPHSPSSHTSNSPSDSEKLHKKNNSHSKKLKADPPKKSPAKKKKKHKKRKNIGCCLGQLLFSLAAFIFLLYSACTLLAAANIKKDPAEPRMMRTAAVYEDPNVRNILIIGSDSRDGEKGRADSMILLSVSRINHTITLTSILRDSYVSIPSKGPDKLNAAYAYGGPTLLMDTIQSNFCIAIDDYICVSFQAMAAITDALGGVEITVSDREADAINQILHDEVNALMGDPQDADYLSGGGTFLLNGKQALSYSRIRYVGNADFERTERQRTVLSGLMNRVKHLSPTAIPALLTDAAPRLSTNMNIGELYLWSLELPYLMLAYDIQTLRMPLDGTYSDQKTSGGAMVLAVDFDANLVEFRRIVQSPPEPSAPES